MKTKETAHDERIAPLMQQIIRICQEERIGMIASYHIPTDDDPTLACTTFLLGGDYAAPPTANLALFVLMAGDEIVGEAIPGLNPWLNDGGVS